MINQQTLSGRWQEVSGKLKEKWGKLTDDDVRTFNGNVDQLIGRIERKTGEAREEIEKYLDRLADDGSGILAGVRDTIETTADHATESAREGYDAMRQGYAEAEKIVQDRPGQALAMAFGVGLLSGLGVALLLRDRNHASRVAQGRSAAEHFGRQMLDALTGIIPDSLTKNVRH
jgi:uncharacterized protein YjbJ (UPF0337 family)